MNIYNNNNVSLYITQPLKRKEILTHATKCLNLKGIMLSEISQKQKDKYYMIPPTCDT